MNNEKVASAWATQKTSKGHGSHFFFIGPTIYSYGGHFPIARFMAVKGRRCVLFTTLGYSRSTSAHKGIARAAIPKNIPVFTVPSIMEVDHVQNLASYAARIEHLKKLAERARTRGDQLLNDAKRLRAQRARYIVFMGCSA